MFIMGIILYSAMGLFTFAIFNRMFPNVGDEKKIVAGIFWPISIVVTNVILILELFRGKNE
jgi:hypothetical protein